MQNIIGVQTTVHSYGILIIKNCTPGNPMSTVYVTCLISSQSRLKSNFVLEEEDLCSGEGYVAFYATPNTFLKNKICLNQD